MKVDEFRSLLDHESREEPVTDEPLAGVVRRARQKTVRRRVLVAGLAGAVVVALAAGSVTWRDTGEPRQQVVAAGRSDVVLALSTFSTSPGGGNPYASEVAYVHPDTGLVDHRPIPVHNYGEYPVQLGVEGNRLLLPSIESAPLDLSTPPTHLVDALVFVPSATAGRVWAITSWPPGDNTPPYNVTELDATGHATSAELALPPTAGWPIAGTNEGLLLRAPNDAVWLWDPDTGQIIRTINNVPNIGFNGWAGPDSFAWAEQCAAVCSTLHLLNLATGAERTIEPPPGTNGFLWDAAPSPDEHTLAVFATTDPATGSPNQATQLALIDTDTGNATIVPQSSGNGAHLAWSPTGNTVYFDDQGSTAIHGYRLGQPSPQTIATRLKPFTALTVIAG